MKFIRRHTKVLALGASCAVLGAGASAIATAGAATSSNAAAGGPAAGLIRGEMFSRALARRTVSGNLVVAAKRGFTTVTINRGFVESVNGQQLTVRDGTRRATYQTVTLTIPTNAIVRDDGHRAALADISNGQHVLVLQGSKGTLVIARTARAS